MVTKWYIEFLPLLQTNFCLYHWEGRRNPLSQIWSVGSRRIACPKNCAALLLNIWWTYRGAEERGCVPSSVFKSATQVQRLTTTWQWGGMLKVSFWSLPPHPIIRIFGWRSTSETRWEMISMWTWLISNYYTHMDRLNREVIYLWKVQRSSSI